MCRCKTDLDHLARRRAKTRVEQGIATTGEGETSLALSIKCSDFSTECDDMVTGSSLQELVHEVQRHAVEHHEWTERGVNSPEFSGLLVSALRQTVRPEELRSLGLSDYIRDAPESKKAP